MSIKLNTNNVDITIYDKINLNHATGSKVIPLKSTSNSTINKLLIDIIGDSLNLNESEKLTYDILLKYLAINNNLTGSIPINYITCWLAKDTNRNAITYRRAIDNLIIKGVIKYNDNKKDVSVNNEYNINVINTTAKYIVIQVI